MKADQRIQLALNERVCSPARPIFGTRGAEVAWWARTERAQLGRVCVVRARVARSGYDEVPLQDSLPHTLSLSSPRYAGTSAAVVLVGCGRHGYISETDIHLGSRFPSVEGHRGRARRRRRRSFRRTNNATRSMRRPLSPLSVRGTGTRWVLRPDWYVLSCSHSRSQRPFSFLSLSPSLMYQVRCVCPALSLSLARVGRQRW